MLHGMQLKRLVKRRGFLGRPYFSGDSHKNFRVVGTTEEFFERYKYGGGQP